MQEQPMNFKESKNYIDKIAIKLKLVQKFKPYINTKNSEIVLVWTLELMKNFILLVCCSKNK